MEFWFCKSWEGNNARIFFISQFCLSFWLEGKRLLSWIQQSKIEYLCLVSKPLCGEIPANDRAKMVKTLRNLATAKLNWVFCSEQRKSVTTKPFPFFSAPRIFFFFPNRIRPQDQENAGVNHPMFLRAPVDHNFVKTVVALLLSFPLLMLSWQCGNANPM